MSTCRILVYTNRMGTKWIITGSNPSDYHNIYDDLRYNRTRQSTKKQRAIKHSPWISIPYKHLFYFFKEGNFYSFLFIKMDIFLIRETFQATKQSCKLSFHFRSLFSVVYRTFFTKVRPWCFFSLEYPITRFVLRSLLYKSIDNSEQVKT